ncbi:MAG: hypothetical protein FJX95_10380 [Bacteroidetes bacterium]|nr:hypothetical protein [Bacteroidota bacterium]
MEEKGKVILKIIDFEVGVKRDFLSAIGRIAKKKFAYLVEGLSDMFGSIEPNGMDAVLVDGNLDGLAWAFSIQF